MAINNNQTLKDKYVYSDKFIDALETAYVTNKNILLYGSGGGGKSAISHDFLVSKGHTPFVFALGNGTSVDRLLGGIDKKALDDHGFIHYLPEFSFLNHEYVILEELLDAPAELLEQLKDILSSGYLRQGNQVFKIKCKLIIVNSNGTRKNFVKASASCKAVMERFPLEIEVKWEHYTAMNYKKLIETSRGVGMASDFLCEILEEYHKNNLTISPRIALEAADLVNACGIDCLNLIGDFNSNIQILEKAKLKQAFVQELNKHALIARPIMMNVKANIHNLTLPELEDNLKVLNDVKFAIDKIKAVDENLETLANFKDKLNKGIEEVKQAVMLNKDAEKELSNAFNF